MVNKNLEGPVSKDVDISRRLIKQLIFSFMPAILILITILISIAPITAAQAVTTCCEKTVDGAYCQNVPFSRCDAKYLSSPTSCDSTSFCQLGTCYDSDDGLCMSNTPKRACEEANGLWTDNENPPQCNLGCCILGEQAAFTTLQRCKKLAGQYGLQADFRDNIEDEISCIAIANAQDVGACVFESEFTKTCKFGTRGECDSAKLPVVTNNSDVNFFKDYLCTSEQLNTNCQKTTKTSCVEGKDEVYFLDSCGNQANIYDSSKINDKNYWEKIVPKSSSCSGNPKNCGNCDYLDGSICAKSERSKSAAHGDFICKDINCYNTANGKDYKNGESWCYYDNGKPDDDRAGSRHYRHACFMGEEIVEPCSDLRKEVCIEDSIGSDNEEGFSQAGCVINRWSDCLLQTRRSDCVNSDVRDCKWIPVSLGEKPGEIVSGVVDQVKEGIAGLLLNVHNSQRDKGACVPDVAPGLEFWGSDGAASQCDLVSSSCVIKYEKKLIGGKKCVENCFCDIEENPSTAIQALNICSSIGDCGPKANYVGKFVNDGYEFVIEDKEIGPKFDLGILDPKNAKNKGREANPAANPTFDQGRGLGNEFPSASQPTSLTGNIVKNIIVEAYNRLS